MPRYKRSAEIAFEEPKPEPAHVETLQRLRSMVEFAAFAEYAYLFGEVVLEKVDSEFDIEDLETECLNPGPSEKLAQIGLALLKLVSSHRGLTLDTFDEYTRRQYLAKAPQRNPFGDDEAPKKFDEFDIFTKIKVLHQLSIWTFGNVDRMRGLMGEEADQLNWRMEPLGWDKDDNEYYVLDDNRLYRRSDAPIPPPSPKPKAKKVTTKKSRNKGTRSSKRRKLETQPEQEEDDTDENEVDRDETVLTNSEQPQQQPDEPAFGFTNKTWECIAVTLEDYQNFLASIFRSRDPNEKQLRQTIEENILPIMEQRAEKMRQKQIKRQRELENLQKLATAKRSSRLAGKAEKDRQERAEQEAEAERQAELRMARQEQERQRRIEEGHESRRLTREQRLKEREMKRILHEEELARLDQEAQRSESQDENTGNDRSKRISGRQLQTQREQHQKELERIAEDEEKWIFDCAGCGLHGENMDDGTHSIACERCSVWQHSKCHGFSPKESEREEFHFICGTCKRAEEDAQKPKIAPLKLGKRDSSGSPKSERSERQAKPPSTEKPRGSGLPLHVQRQLDGVYLGQEHTPSAGPFGRLTTGPGYGQGGHPFPTEDLANGHSLHGDLSSPQSAVGTTANNAPTFPLQSTEEYRYAEPEATLYIPYDPHAPKGRPPAPTIHRVPPRPADRPPNGGYVMNGIRSPAKAKRSASPTQHIPQPVISHTPAQPQGSPFTNSPNLSFPPPSYAEHPHSSPIKSSPPPSRAPAPAQADYEHQRQALQKTPQALRPPSANGYSGNETRQTALEPMSNGVAADGMSGPWPEGSKAIPEKHDASPAPPASVRAIGGIPVLPPVSALAPSSSQQIEGSTGTVPVKKAPET